MMYLVHSIQKYNKINLWQKKYSEVPSRDYVISRKFQTGSCDLWIGKNKFSLSLDAVRSFIFTKNIFLRTNGYLWCGLSAILRPDSQFNNSSHWSGWRDNIRDCSYLIVKIRDQTLRESTSTPSSITVINVGIWSHHYFYFGYWGYISWRATALSQNLVVSIATCWLLIWRRLMMSWSPGEGGSPS